MEITRYGNFREGDYVAIPFRHHKNNSIWDVMVLKKLQMERIRVIGFNAEDAARDAISKFEAYRDERKFCANFRKTKEQGDEPGKKNTDQ